MKHIGLTLFFLLILILSVNADEDRKVAPSDQKAAKEIWEQVKLQKGVFDENDSLYSQMAVRLYFNHFVKDKTTKIFSSRFMVKKFVVDDDLQTTSENVDTYGLVADKDSVMKGFLFVCEGEQTTDLFLHNREAMVQCISTMFGQMQNDDQLRGLNLYFPDFSFKEKRAMVQFVKSVRMTMDASKNFKFGKTALSVIFLGNNKEKADNGFLYSLLQESGDILLLDSLGIINNDAVIKGERKTLKNLGKVGFIGQLRSHLYLSRYYIGSENVDSLDIKIFSVEKIGKIYDMDYIENTWEIYFFTLIGLLILIVALVVLYYVYLPFSYFINNNSESVVFVILVVVVEIIALVTCIFLFMCKEDSFQIINKNPILLFLLPLVFVFIVPFLNGLRKKRKLP